MLWASPHRGPVTSVFGEAGWAIATQQNKSAHPFLTTGTWCGKRNAVAVAGCIFTKKGIVAGNDAAKAIGEAFSAFGDKELGRLSGSFAAVIVEPAKKKLISIISAVGERPLFWRTWPDTVGLASEIKQLVVVDPSDLMVDQDAVLDVIALRFDRPERTSYTNVNRVGGGTIVTFQDGAVQRNTFWDLLGRVGTSDLSLDDAVGEFRRRMRISISRRIVRESAVLLSGGLDSASIAAEASGMHSEKFGTPLMAISAAYPEYKTADEMEYVRQISGALGLNSKTVRPMPDFLTRLSEDAWLHDGLNFAPMSDNLHKILSLSRKAGQTCLVDGHDGDSVLGFGGPLVREFWKRRHISLIPGYLRFRRQRLHVGLSGVLRRDLLSPMLQILPAIGNYSRQCGRRRTIPTWVYGPLRSRMSHEDAPASGAARHWWTVSQKVNLELELLERAALSEGISLVHPFADPDLVDFLITLPPQLKYARGEPKALLRASYGELPRSVRYRYDKTSFDEVVLSGAQGGKLITAIDKGPQVVPGVDWAALRKRCFEAIGVTELMLIRRVLECDRFLVRR